MQLSWPRWINEFPGFFLHASFMIASLHQLSLLSASIQSSHSRNTVSIFQGWRAVDGQLLFNKSKSMISLQSRLHHDLEHTGEDLIVSSEFSLSAIKLGDPVPIMSRAPLWPPEPLRCVPFCWQLGKAAWSQFIALHQSRNLVALALSGHTSSFFFFLNTCSDVTEFSC